MKCLCKSDMSATFICRIALFPRDEEGGIWGVKGAEEEKGWREMERYAGVRARPRPASRLAHQSHTI